MQSHAHNKYEFWISWFSQLWLFPPHSFIISQQDFSEDIFIYLEIKDSYDFQDKGRNWDNNLKTFLNWIQLKQFFHPGFEETNELLLKQNSLANYRRVLAVPCVHRLISLE